MQRKITCASQLRQGPSGHGLGRRAAGQREPERGDESRKAEDGDLQLAQHGRREPHLDGQEVDRGPAAEALVARGRRVREVVAKLLKIVVISRTKTTNHHHQRTQTVAKIKILGALSLFLCKRDVKFFCLQVIMPCDYVSSCYPRFAFTSLPYSIIPLLT